VLESQASVSQLLWAARFDTKKLLLGVRASRNGPELLALKIDELAT